MESAKLDSNSPDDAQIETWLRTNSTVAPLPEDGFSARVMAGLPPPQRRPGKSSLRPWLCAAGAVIGCLFAASPGTSGPAVIDQLATLLSAMRAAFAPLSDPSVTHAIAVTGISLLFVYRRALVSRLAH